MEPGVGYAVLDLDPGERFVRLRQQLGVTSFGLNLIVLRPGQRGRIHRHERQEEVYLVLDGELTLIVDGEERPRLRRGEAVRVAPELRRQLVNAGREACAILAIGGAGEHAGRDGLAYASWDDPLDAGRSPQEVPLPPDVAIGG
jgi:uncharacterized cupin superfamily protein